MTHTHDSPLFLTRTFPRPTRLLVSISILIYKSWYLFILLVPANEMRFNKQEMITLAQQPSNKFDKEGLLFVRERQEGFFRRTESEY